MVRNAGTMLVRPFGAGAERSTQGLAATLQVACRWWTSARRDHSLHALRARGSLAYAMRRWARRETSHSALDIFGRRAVERRRLAVSHARLLFSFEPVSPRGDDHPGFNNVPYPHALGVWYTPSPPSRPLQGSCQQCVGADGWQTCAANPWFASLRLTHRTVYAITPQ